METETIRYVSYLWQGFGAFTGVFLGVIAGTAVTVLVHHWFYRRNEKMQIKNMKFELELNCRKLEGWLEELNKYRNSVNGDSLHTYFGYYKLSSAIGVATNQLHTSGVLYKYLSHEHIGQIQEVFNDLSLPGENYMNNQISQRKQTLTSLEESGQGELWHKFLKQQVIRDIDFWEQKFKSHLNSLRTIIEGLR